MNEKKTFLLTAQYACFVSLGKDVALVQAAVGIRSSHSGATIIQQIDE